MAWAACGRPASESSVIGFGQCIESDAQGGISGAVQNRQQRLAGPHAMRDGDLQERDTGLVVDKKGLDLAPRLLFDRDRQTSDRNVVHIQQGTGQHLELNGVQRGAIGLVLAVTA